MSSLPTALPNLNTISEPLQQLIKNPAYDDFLVLGILLAGSITYISRGILWDKPDPYYHQWFERPQAAVEGVTKAARSTRNIAEKLTETGKKAVIFWGSQSGTAESFAHRLARDFHRCLELDALVADVSDYDHHTIAELSDSQYAVFIMSTYGEGDPSDNSTTFLSWLKARPEISLQKLRFAAFGCGNSNYKYYNAVVDDVVNSLESLGANRFLRVGKADEAKGTTDEDFLEWKTELFKALCSQLGLTEREHQYEPSVSVVFDESIDQSGVYLGEPPAAHQSQSGVSSGSSSSPIAPLPVSSTQELVKDASEARSCLHLELDLSDHPEIKYKTGDHLAVRPINPTSEVALLVDILGLSGRENIPVMIQPIELASEKLNVPSPSTVSALFSYYLEICAPVSRDTVLSLAQFASTQTVKDYFLSLASDKVTFSAFLAKHHITFARLLKHAHTIDPTASWTGLPLSFVVESLRPITPRYYSISSSSITSPRRATITVANNPQLLSDDLSTSIPGLTSTYLSSFLLPPTTTTSTTTSQPPSSGAPEYAPLVNPSLSSSTPANPILHASIRRSKFKLPASPSTPIILIAAGTGIAPFRAFLHERARFASLNKPVGRTMLFFGCRHPDQDLLYKDELEHLQSSSGLPDLEVVYAFSRHPEQQAKAQKVYVQDRVDERREEVVKLLLEENAALYICGSASMAREVGVRVGEAVKQVRKLDDEGLKQWRDDRKRAKRWQEDVWG